MLNEANIVKPLSVESSSFLLLSNLRSKSCAVIPDLPNIFSTLEDWVRIVSFFDLLIVSASSEKASVD